MTKKKHLCDTCELMVENHLEFVKIRSAIDRLIHPITLKYGITSTQFLVLNLIRKSECATVSTLFRSLDFNQGNMSSMCKKLEADGFIEKTRCADDERKTYLTLTEKGNEALHSLDEFFNGTDNEYWIPEEEFLEAEAALTVLKNTAKKINIKLEEAIRTSQNGENNA